MRTMTPGDLVWMNVEILRKLDHGLLALDRCYSHFRLECRAVVPARLSAHGLLLVRSIMPLLLGKSTYPLVQISAATSESLLHKS